MEITTFKDMYLAELQELVSVEQQLGEALLRMAKVASHPSLRAALERHQRETIMQEERLRSILEKHDAAAEQHTDQAMQALIREAEKMCVILKDGYLRDAGLIASAQKLEHYEIAAYGSVAALAGQLNLREDQRLLHNALDEEKRADELLTTLAKGEINQDALAA
ncbi:MULTISPECIES: YciE/YciF ferroxidase family protein [unclassified Bradyrhizobium]